MIDLIQAFQEPLTIIVQESSAIELLRSGAISERQYLTLVGGGTWAPLIAQITEALKVLVAVAVSVIFAKYNTSAAMQNRTEGAATRYKEAAIEAMADAGILPNPTAAPKMAQQVPQPTDEGGTVPSSTLETLNPPRE